MLQGSRLLPRPLCFQEAQGVLGGHPCPTCPPAQTLLCTLVPGALSLQGPPWLLLVLSGLVPREAPGFEGRTPHRQAVLVLLWSLEDRGALVCLECQVNPSPRGNREVLVAPAAPGIPMVLSGHLFHHILGSLCVLEGRVGLGDLEVLEDHSLLVPLSEGRHFQGGLGARELLLDRRGQEVPDLLVDLGQECPLQELFLWHLLAQAIQVSLGGQGDLFLQKGLGEKFPDSQGLPSPLLAQVCPLDQAGPLRANLKRLWLLSDPLNHASRSDRAPRRDLLFLGVLVPLDLPPCLLALDPPFLLEVPAAQVPLDYLDTRVVQRHQVILAFRVVLWGLERRASPDLRVLRDVLDIQGHLVHPLDQGSRTDLQGLLCLL